MSEPTPVESRRVAASRLRAAADAAGPDPLLCSVLTAVADIVEPDSEPSIDVDGTGFMLDRRAERIAAAIVGEDR